MESGVSPLLRPYLSLFLAVDKKISTPESLKEMISDINRDKVDVEDRLSDAAYCFENGVFLKTMS